jgi:hypothetical protein
LSQTVATKLLGQHGLFVSVPLVCHGNVNLKRKAPSLNRSAKGTPVLLVTDLDDLRVCPASLIQDWLGAPRSPNLLFRVAVAEIESWLLADSVGLSRYLDIGEGLIPKQPDNVQNPKLELINLARRTRVRDLREDLVPEVGSTARVGRAYNAAMVRFVTHQWSAERAAPASPSLLRAIARIAEYASKVSTAT